MTYRRDMTPQMAEVNLARSIESVDVVIIDSAGSLRLAHYGDSLISQPKPREILLEELDECLGVFRRTHQNVLSQEKARMTDCCADELGRIAKALEKDGVHLPYEEARKRYHIALPHNKQVGQYVTGFLMDLVQENFILPTDKSALEAIQKNAGSGLSLEDASNVYVAIKESEQKQVALLTEDWGLIKEVARLAYQAMALGKIRFSPKVLRSADGYQGQTAQRLAEYDKEVRRYATQSPRALQPVFPSVARA